jgi:hypothetical protein
MFQWKNQNPDFKGATDSAVEKELHDPRRLMKRG